MLEQEHFIAASPLQLCSGQARLILAAVARLSVCTAAAFEEWDL